uniref:Uncharacterized protein n=1 Tax=Solanum tuberosum TaxID=4113 RepID=M1CKH4_SOLTU
MEEYLCSLCLDPEKKAMATRPTRYLMLYLKIDSKRIMSMMGRQSRRIYMKRKEEMFQV